MAEHVTLMELAMLRWIDQASDLLRALQATAPPELKRKITRMVKSDGFTFGGISTHAPNPARRKGGPRGRS